MDQGTIKLICWVIGGFSIYLFLGMFVVRAMDGGCSPSESRDVVLILLWLPTALGFILMIPGMFLQTTLDEYLEKRRKLRENRLDGNV